MISHKSSLKFKKEYLKPIFFLILLLLGIKGTFVSASVSYVSHSELWSLLRSDEKLLLIDVRTKVEYNKDHIPTAINIHYMGNLSQIMIDVIHKHSFNRLIAYCSCTEGYTAKQFIEQLIANGELSKGKALFLSESYRYWPFQRVMGSEPGELDISFKRTLFPLDALIAQFGLIFLIDFMVIIFLLMLLKRQFRKQYPNHNFVG